MPVQRPMLLRALLSLLPLAVSAQTLAPANLNPIAGAVTAVTYKGRPAVRLLEAPGQINGAAAILKDTDFHDGIIEADLAGALAPTADATARGFVGLAFRSTADAVTYECIYLRPLNGRDDDQERRNHSVQYISHPEYPWQRLRKEAPSRYETYVDLIPGEWAHVKIEVKGNKARLWVNGASQPTLIVNDLKHGANAHGAIALWIGPGTDAHFANLKITPTATSASSPKAR